MQGGGWGLAGAGSCFSTPPEVSEHFCRSTGVEKLSQVAQMRSGSSLYPIAGGWFSCWAWQRTAGRCCWSSSI